METSQQAIEVVIEKLSSVSLQVTFAIIFAMALMSFFSNRKITFKYLKRTVSVLLFIAFTTSNILFYISNLKFDINEKVFNTKIELTNQDYSQEKIKFLNEKLKKYEENIKGIDSLSNLAEILQIVLVIVVFFFWTHFLISVWKFFEVFYVKVSYMSLYWSLFLINFINPLYVIPFTIVSIIYLANYNVNRLSSHKIDIKNN